MIKNRPTYFMYNDGRYLLLEDFQRRFPRRCEARTSFC